MSILPGLDRVMERFLERREVVKRSATFVVVSANRCFGEIKVAVTARVIAFAKKRGVLVIGKRRNVQSMRGAEARLHSEKNILVRPDLGEKILALVQTDAMDRQDTREPFPAIQRRKFRR